MDMPPNSPTPDWGTLGPGSDIKVPAQTGIGLAVPPAAQRPAAQRLPQTAGSIQRVMIVASLAMSLGMFFFFQYKLSDRRADQRIQSGTTRPGTQTRGVDQNQQREAERLLQRAAANDSAATAEIEARAPAWHGRISLTPQLTNLVGAGLNAHDLRVRAATVQLDLAAMNVNEDAGSVDRLARQAESNDHAKRIWAIWTLGLLGNRGIERDRITAILISHLGDVDLDSRHWAVEALSYIGTDETIPPLLKTLHDDSAPLIRERAACAIAESGMLTNQQRRNAIPTLLAYAEDASLDSQTHVWVYHALRDITAQNLPDDAVAWRQWFDSHRQ